MAKTYDLLVRARGETKDAERAMQQLQRKVDRFGRGMRQAGTALTMGITLPVAALARVGIEELNSMQKANAQTFAALKSTGGAAGVTASQIQKMATNLSKLSGIDDQVIQGGENILLTFTKIGKQDRIFARATKAALDLSVAFGKDMNSSAIMVGKALNDPIKGLTALGRVGVQFTEKQKKTIEALVEGGRVASAQKIILKELETQIGGSAKAYGDTAAGAVGKLKEQFAGLGAEMVSGFLPAFTQLGNALQRGMNWFSALDASTKKWVGTALLIGAALGPVLFVMGSLVSASVALAPVLLGISAPMVGVAAGATAAGIALVALYKRSETARLLLKELWAGLKASPLGMVVRAVNAVAQSVGGWGNVFRYAGIAALGFAKVVLEMALRVTQTVNDLTGNWLQKFSTIIRAVALIKPEFKGVADIVHAMSDRSRESSSKMERSMTRDLRAIDMQIGNLKRSIAGLPSLKEISIRFKTSGQLPSNYSQGGFYAPPGAAGKSGRVSKRGAEGRSVDVFGKMFGSTGLAEVLAYAANSSNAAYTTSTDENGGTAVTENTAVTSFLRTRIDSSKARIGALLGKRSAAAAQIIKSRKALMAAYKALGVAKKKRNASGIAAANKKIEALRKKVGELEGVIEYCDQEIMQLGGQVESDQDALEPPLDTTAEAAATAAKNAAKDAEALRRQALGLMSVEEEAQLEAINAIRARYGLPPVKSAAEASQGGSSGSGGGSLLQQSIPQQLLPSSVSALGAVRDTAFRALTGSGVNINVTPNSADPEAIAQRVAWILGSGRLRAGGAF